MNTEQPNLISGAEDIRASKPDARKVATPMPSLRHPRPRTTAWDTSLPGIHAVAVLALLDPAMPVDRPGSCAGRDPEMWFPDVRHLGLVAEAKAICADCPVRIECLHAGLGEEYGIWGGLTPSERGAMLRAA